MNDYDIESAIPHRPPFLLLDDVTHADAERVSAVYTPRPDDPLWSLVYSGHYPGGAITPGVLLCEMLFQASAVMVHEIAKNEPLTGVPVVTRISQVKFKNIVPPGRKLDIAARLVERLANAFFMKGDIKADGKTVLQAEFAVALADNANNANTEENK